MLLQLIKNSWGKMMKQSREENMLHYLEQHEYLSTEKAVEIFQVSPATIRRIFTKLAENNSARRVRGGVRRLSPGANASIPFLMREQWFASEKALLAKRAMEFVPPDGVIFIHSGSTTLYMGNHIANETVITDSTALCELLRTRFPSGGPQVIVAGGTYDLKAGAIAGSRAASVIMQYHANVAFFSARGMDDEGILDTNDELAAVARSMVTRAERVVMLADHSKFREFGMSRMVLWNRIHFLITTDFPDNYPFFRKIEQAGVKIILI